MKRVFVALLSALVLTSCLNSDDLGVEGSKEYTYHGDLLTTYVDTQETAYDSRTETTEDGTPKLYEVKVESPDVNLLRVNIVFNGVKFVPRMPELVITMPNLAYTVEEVDGATMWNIDCESVVPTIAGTEYPSYEMHNVECRMSASSLAIDFDITVSGTDYHVHYSTPAE